MPLVVTQHQMFACLDLFSVPWPWGQLLHGINKTSESPIGCLCRLSAPSAAPLVGPTQGNFGIHFRTHTVLISMQTYANFCLFFCQLFMAISKPIKVRATSILMHFSSLVCFDNQPVPMCVCYNSQAAKPPQANPSEHCCDMGCSQVVDQSAN